MVTTTSGKNYSEATLESQNSIFWSPELALPAGTMHFVSPSRYQARLMIFLIVLGICAGNRPKRVPSTSVIGRRRAPLRVPSEPPTPSRSRGIAGIFPGCSWPPAPTGPGAQNRYFFKRFQTKNIVFSIPALALTGSGAQNQ